jgi:primosomal protein N''
MKDATIAFCVSCIFQPEAFINSMNKLRDYITELLQNMKNMDRAKLAKELKEIAYHMNKQLFSQIPGHSGIEEIYHQKA